jgi:hypothetical protein
LIKVGVPGVKRLEVLLRLSIITIYGRITLDSTPSCAYELVIRGKIDQRTTGGPMALRKAFKYFDTDGSGDIDPDEFFSAMRAFGLEFTEDQVLAF